MPWDVFKRAPVALLILSNLIPIVGVLRWGWDVTAIVILYWSENLIIGAATIVKMISRAPIAGLFQSIFFTVHYGGFCGLHGFFLLLLVANTPVPFETTWPFILVFVEILVNVVRKAIEIAPPEWMLAFAALSLSHGVSLVKNYFLGGERERMQSKQLMIAPYKRVFVLHAAIVFGGMGVMALGSPEPLLLVLIVGKILIDVYAHLREHALLPSTSADSAIQIPGADPDAGR